jgi:DNA-binding transcriptional regulator YdaS (Cro superfamily)
MATMNLARARAAWGERLPDWVEALATACDRSSQGRVAALLGISATTVNQTLGRAYRGRMDRVEARVRGELMRETVVCPVLGEISRRACLDHQSRRYSPTNLVRVQLFTACRTCENREERT